MAVEGDGSRGLEELTVDCAEDPNIIVRAGSGSDDGVVLVHHLHELADHERHRLNSLHLLLSAEELALQVLELVLHILLLDLDEL